MRAATWILGTLRRLLSAAAPPLTLAMLASGVAQTHVLGAFLRCGACEALAEGPASATELAPRLGVDADILHRLLRFLAAQGLLQRGRDGRFVLTATGRFLTAGHPMSFRDFVLYWSSRSNVLAWAGLEEGLRSGRSPFRATHGMSVWAWFEAHEDERLSFARTMALLTRAEADAVARHRAWDGVTHVMDVAGGRGILLADVLRHHPGLRGTLVEQASLLPTAAPVFASRGVPDRVRLVAGSLFGDLPEGADAACLKNILHDWDDATCHGILERVRRALPPGGRLLIVEAVLPPSLPDEPLALADLQMFVACEDGRERTEEEYQRLLARAGFRLEAVHPLPGPSSLLVAVAAESESDAAPLSERSTP
jgi:SAM-dependent methyltransferase